MDGTIGTILDLAVLVLLVVTIGYAVVLHRKLTALRQGEAEIRTLIEDLTMAAEKADGAIRSMKATAQSSGDALNRQIERAQVLTDELKSVIEAGTTLSDTLEHRGFAMPGNAVRPGAADGAYASPRSGGARDPERSGGGQPRRGEAASGDNAERELLEAIQNLR